MSIHLYKHNEDAYRAVETMLEEKQMAAVIHPTGTGKSMIAFKLVEQHPHKHFLWLSPSEYIYKTQLENIDTQFSNIEYMSYSRLMKHEDSIDTLRPDYIIPIVANHDGIVDYACEEWVDEVLIPPCAESEYPYEMADIFLEMGIAVHRGITKNKVMAGNFNQIEKIGDYTVITASMNYASTTQLLAKRGMDILGGLVGCIITLIVTIFVGPAIYIASPGPIFFAQERIGRNGRKFKMYKFRSMYMDAEERKKELMSQNKVSDGMMFKMDFDPRIIGNKILPDGTKKTGIGQFIRKTSIDELPQFWNILKGDMSLVGTRPPTLDEWDKYEPHHRARMSFRPGLTGLWQVSGRSNITDFEEVVKLDTQYINEWSVKGDIEIIWQTAIGVLRNDGAM